MNTEIVNTRTGIGAAIGGVIGFMCAGPMGAGIGAMVGGGVAHAAGEQQSHGVMTPRRKLIYTRALETVKEPADLHKLADAFAGEGLDAEACVLRKRADLRNLPEDTKEKRRVFFRKAMACDDANVIGKVAAAFQQEGALDAAKALLDHAEAVRAAHAAGKSAKPLAGGSQSQFADKLAKALIHFGPGSVQAQTAAKNLIQARGKAPSPAMVKEVIKVAVGALNIEAPAATGAPAAPIEIDATADAGPGPEAAVEPLAVPSDLAPVPVEEAVAEVQATPRADIEKPVVGGPAPALEPENNAAVAEMVAESEAAIPDTASVPGVIESSSMATDSLGPGAAAIPAPEEISA